MQVPRSVQGKVFGMIWALVGFVIVAVFTAMFTNIMEDTGARPEKLQGSRVGVLNGSLERLRVLHAGGEPVGNVISTTYTFDKLWSLVFMAEFDKFLVCFQAF